MCKLKVFILFLFFVLVMSVSCQEYSPLIKPSGELAKELSKTICWIGKPLPGGMVAVEKVGEYRSYMEYIDPNKVARKTMAEKQRDYLKLCYADARGSVVASGVAVLRSNYNASEAWLKEVEQILIDNSWDRVRVNGRDIGVYSRDNYYAYFEVSEGVRPLVTFMNEDSFTAFYF
jgi:hypothetical protein